ncbi:ATP-binding cassette domain-containing protein [Myxococcus sp. AM001]|uniref:ABC transporter ATP-binding protein n=1 Tax=Myxococcus vastator TaxID=2709664 RepID=UPI0013D27F11|nr:ATP-binding cassette domain-containing protein [Myxococcus vastator]NVJ04327.1 ATP-binding cassette domain-containing protein [Myxococcus sp. AM001]
MLEAKKLSKRYGQHLALEGLDLSIGAGEVFCLLGANGAGKTTTLNLFLGFITPTQGEARVAGLAVQQHEAQVRGLLAYVPELVMLYPRLTGRENLAYFNTLAGRPALSPQESTGWLANAGLQPGAMDVPVGRYSKGMRQKVGIAIALAKGARALLLDEPTSGLDPLASNELSELLLRLSGEGMAVLMATHDLFRAKESGTRVGIMKAGRLVETRATRDLGHAELEQLYLAHMRG